MKQQGERILVVDDESSITGALELIMRDRGYMVETASNVREAIALFDNKPYSVVLTDLKLPDESGIALLTHIKRAGADTEVILMTAHGSLDVTIEAIKKGAFYYIEKPFNPDHVVMLTERAMKQAAIRRQCHNRKPSKAGEEGAFGMVGRSPAMLQIYETIRLTAESDASVLIEGESGTGKELIAAAFHFNSKRVSRPFIRINCAAIPRDLIESELFGYRKGAFTGADRDKRGLIEAGAGGTLLLDEIAEMPAHIQAKLLRVLQERQLRRLGDERESSVDFRLIAATNRDTLQAIGDGSLREDLYYRISTIKIQVPPLRERLDDISLLAALFLDRFSRRYKKPVRSISDSACRMLLGYCWPGNVRELESVIEHAVLFCQSDQIMPESLPEQIRIARPGDFKCVIAPYLALEEIEREAIEQTLARTGGNVKQTARILKLHRPTLYRKLKKYGIKC
ncbi:MAG: sigma-54 dependent transcriptional regulator [Acidobacteriota bacterium]